MDQHHIARPFCLVYHKGHDPLNLVRLSQAILYADNLLLYRLNSSTADYCALRQDIADIEAWSLKNCLKLNVDKCKYMVIARKENPLAPTLPFLLNGLPIEKVKSFKYIPVP